MVPFSFLPQHLGSWQGPTNVTLSFFQNTGSMLGIPQGDGGAQTLAYAKEFV